MKGVLGLLACALMPLAAQAQQFNFPAPLNGGSGGGSGFVVPGTDQQVLYNGSGSAAAATGLTYSSASQSVAIGGAGVSSTLNVSGTTTVSYNNGGTWQYYNLQPAQNSLQLRFAQNGNLQVLDSSGNFTFSLRNSGSGATGAWFGRAASVPLVTTPLEVSGIISATTVRLSSSTTACAAASDVGNIVRNPAKNTYGVCVAALSVAPLVTTTVISPSAL